MGYLSRGNLLSQISPEKIRPFFTDENGKLKDIHSVATDGSAETRAKWAQIVSGLEGIQYKQGDECEIKAGWENIIKVICLLLKGYKKTSEKTEAAANIIKSINSGETEISRENLFNIIDDILKIREDVDFETVKEINTKLSLFKSSLLKEIICL